jgi:hypothetical protein
MVVHPQTQAFVANELNSTDCLIYGSILLFASIQLVLVDQHCCLLSPMLLCRRISLYIDSINPHRDLYYRRMVLCKRNEKTGSICTSLSVKNRGWNHSVKRKIFPSQSLLDVQLMHTWLGMTQRMPLCPSPKKGTTIHPPLERRGLSGPFTVI